jgi:hypothetical protein
MSPEGALHLTDVELRMVASVDWAPNRHCTKPVMMWLVGKLAPVIVIRAPESAEDVIGVNDVTFMIGWNSKYFPLSVKSCPLLETSRVPFPTCVAGLIHTSLYELTQVAITALEAPNRQKI